MSKFYRLFLPVLAVLAGFAVSCEKPSVELKEAVVEDFVFPESIRLDVGDEGSFEVVVKPTGAVDAREASVVSSDPSVLAVSIQDMVFSYKAVKPGEVTVTVKVGKVSKQAFFEVVGEDPNPGNGGPVVSGGVKVEFFPGIRNIEKTLSPAHFSVLVESGPEAGNYVLSYSVDGREKTVVRGLFKDVSRDVSLDVDLALGMHAVAVEVTEEKGMIEPVFIDGQVWVKGESLSVAEVRFTSDFGADFLLGGDAPVSLAKGEVGKVSFRHEPALTSVTRSYDVPEFLSLDFENGKSENGLLVVPFFVTADSEGTMSVKFVNGDEETVVAGAVNGKSSRPLGATDFSVPDDYEIALGGGSQTYTFVTVPEHSYKPEITKLTSSNEEILKVSWRDLTATFTPVYTGEVTVTVVLSGIEKSFKVKVVGDVVTDFVVPQDLTMIMGESYEFEMEVKPKGALDGEITALSSSDESVLKVRAEQGFVLHLDALKPGSVKVSVSVGKISKEFPVTVLSDEVSDYKVPENMQLALGGGSQAYTFTTTPEKASNAVITAMSSSDEGILKVSWKDLTATFTPVYKGTAVVKMTLGGIEKSFSVSVVGDVVTDFSVPQNLELVMGDVYDYEFTTTPVGALDAKMEKISSSDESVVKVTYNGLKATLTAGKMGSATVSVTIGKVTKTFDVKVLGKYVSDFSVPKDFSVELGSPKSYTFTVTPEGAIDAKIEGFKSSDETLLKVESAGELSLNFIPVYPGTVTVSVTVGSVTKNFPVKVTGTVVTDFTVPQDLSLQRTQKFTFTMVASPEDAVDIKVNDLRCSDASVLSVSNDGMKLSFEALKAGTATVSVTVGRKVKSFDVKVTPKLVTDFSVPTGMEVDMLASKTYDVTVAPADADDAKIVSAKSSDEKVLKVSYEGLTLKLEGVYEGSADVTVKVGTVEKKFTVKVLGRYVKDFSVPTGMEVEIGHSDSYTFVPSEEHCIDAAIKSIKSADTSILEVSYDGLTATFKALYVGNVQVIVTVGSVEKKFFVNCTGTVVTGIDVPAAVSGASIAFGSTVTANVLPVPSNAYDAGTMKVEALNPNIVTVTELGNYGYAFKAVGFGDASFRATCGRQTTTFSCKVPETVSLSASTKSVEWGESLTVKVEGVNAGWSWSVSGAAFEDSYKGADDSPLKITLDGDSFVVTNRSRQRAVAAGKLTVKTNTTGVTAVIDLSAQAVLNKNVVTVTPGADDDRVFFDVEVKAGASNVTLNSIAFYIFSSDSESNSESDIRNRAAAAIRSASPEGVLVGKNYTDIQAREYSFFPGKTVNLWEIYRYRYYLDEHVNSYVASDSYGKYSDGFGMEGYVYSTLGKEYFSY